MEVTWVWDLQKNTSISVTQVLEKRKQKFVIAIHCALKQINPLVCYIPQTAVLWLYQFS